MFSTQTADKTHGSMIDKAQWAPLFSPSTVSCPTVLCLQDFAQGRRNKPKFRGRSKIIIFTNLDIASVPIATEQPSGASIV